MPIGVAEQNSLFAVDPPSESSQDVLGKGEKAKKEPKWKQKLQQRRRARRHSKVTENQGIMTTRIESIDNPVQAGGVALTTAHAAEKVQL